MLDRSRMHSVPVDPHHRIVRAEAGVTWTEVRPRDPSLRVGHRRRRGRVHRGDGHLRDGARIDLTHHDQTVQLLSVYLKSGCCDNATPSSARATLVRQVPVLEGWIDAAAQGLTLCIGLGDFNLRLTQPNDWVWAELDDGKPVNADLTALTQDMPVSGQDHTLTEVIDHIVVPGVAVQLVLKPSVWSRNKISDLSGRSMDYRSKFNSLLRFPSRSTILPLGTSFRP